MRVDVYTHQDAYVGTIGPDELLALTHTDELNGEDSVSITTSFPLKQGYRLVWADRLGKAHEHICQDPKGLHAQGRTVYTDTALNSVYELTYDYIEDKRPYSYSFLKALQVALENTRWECGTVDQSGTVSSGLTFYHTSARAALNDILECGGELETVIEVGGEGVTSRKVGIRQHRGESSTHRRFTYTKDLVSIGRTEHYGAITACYGYGKGVETDSGGYGRKLTFGDINDGKNYVEDASAVKAWGRPDGKGGFAHVFGEYEDSDCEDAAVLLSETRAYLDEHKEPGMTYEADVVDLVQFGRSWEGVGVGDDVQIVDTEFSPALRCQGRVTKLVTDLLGGTQTVTLGNVTETMADMWSAQQQKVSSLSKRSSNWDVAANTPAAYLQQVVDGLNAQFNAQGNSYCYTSFEQGTIWASVPLDENGLPTKTGGSAIQICSQGFRIASGTKADGSWDWRTFGTGNGFTADLITTGSLLASLITAGIIQDKTGNNYWNLDTGELRMTGYAKDSETISSVDVEYAQNQSAVTAPTSGWQTAAPAYKSGYYIWSRTKTVYADPDTQPSYSTPVMISGRDGADGKTPTATVVKSGTVSTITITNADGTVTKATVNDGTNGTKGANGYVHVKYSDDGGKTFTGNSGEDPGKYIGVYTDNTEADSTSVSTYTWSLVKGADGDDGIGVTAIVEQYYLSTSKTAQSGGSWSETQPAYVSGRYYWTRSKVTWTDGNVTYTDPVLAQGVNNANEEAKKANDAVDALSTQESIYNLLTNGGKTQGLYLKDKNLYINASYIGAGVYQIQDADGNVIVKMGNDVENGMQVLDPYSGTMAALSWASFRPYTWIDYSSLSSVSINDKATLPSDTGAGGSKIIEQEFSSPTGAPTLYAGPTGRVLMKVFGSASVSYDYNLKNSGTADVTRKITYSGYTQATIGVKPVGTSEAGATSTHQNDYFYNAIEPLVIAAGASVRKKNQAGHPGVIAEYCFGYVDASGKGISYKPGELLYVYAMSLFLSTGATIDSSTNLTGTIFAAGSAQVRGVLCIPV